MINEFRGVTEINFNPESGSTGATSSVSITGEAWLLNWGMDVSAHPHLMADAVGALVAFTGGLLVVAFVLMHTLTRYVK